LDFAWEKSPGSWWETFQFERATLFIRDTKFHKADCAVGPQMGERLKRYLEQQFGGPGDPEAPLFSFTKRGAIHECTISLAFHSLVPRLGLHVPAAWHTLGCMT